MIRPSFSALLPLLLLDLAASGNTLTIHERSGAGQKNVPVQVGRPFARGEFPNGRYPQAVAAGTALITQVNVKTRWEDGSIKHAVVSFVLPQLNARAGLQVVFQQQPGCNCGSGSGLNKPHMLDGRFDFDAVIEASAGGVARRVSARRMLESGHYAYWLEGAVATTIILADHSPARVWDFGWKRPPAATLTAAVQPGDTVLEVSDTSSFRPGQAIYAWQPRNGAYSNFIPWHEQMRVCAIDGRRLTLGGIGRVKVSSGIADWVDGDYFHAGMTGKAITINGRSYSVTRFLNSRRVAVSGAPEIAQPVPFSACGTPSGRGMGDSFTGIRSFSAGHKVSPAGNSNDLRLPADDRYRSIRPVFEATFWPALGKVWVRYIGENSNTETLQTLTYDLTLRAGDRSPAVVFTRGALLHHPGSRWTRTAWIGGAPGEIHLDHNLADLVRTAQIPNYDLTLTQAGRGRGSSSAERLYQAWDDPERGNQILGDFGALSQKYTTGPGQFAERGWWPSWVVWYLYRMNDAKEEGPRLHTITWGNADLAQYAVFYREGSELRNGRRRFYDLPGKVPAYGRPLSPVARPGAGFLAGWAANSIPEPDRILSVGPWTAGSRPAPPSMPLHRPNARIEPGFEPDVAHMPDPWSIPYLLSGDYWYLEQLQLATGWRLAAEASNRRPGGAPVITGHGDVRSESWGARLLAQTWLLSPDGTPEKELAAEGLRAYLAVQEGIRGITGSLDSRHRSYWLHGRLLSIRFQLCTDLNQSPPWFGGFSPLGVWSLAACSDNLSGDSQAYGINKAVIAASGSGFEHGYQVGVLGMLARYGWPAQALLRFTLPYYEMALDPRNGPPFPWILDCGRIPVRRSDFHNGFEGSLTDDGSTLEGRPNLASRAWGKGLPGFGVAFARLRVSGEPVFWRRAVNSGRYARSFLLFRLPDSFSLSDEAWARIAEWRNGSTLVASASIARHKGSYWLTTTRYSSPPDIWTAPVALQADTWYGVRTTYADLYFPRPSFSASLMQPTRNDIGNAWSLASHSPASPPLSLRPAQHGISEFRFGLLEFSPGARPAGELWLDSAVYVGATLRLVTSPKELAAGFHATRDDHDRYRASYVEPIYSTKSGYDNPNGPTVDEDFAPIHEMALAGLYPLSEIIRRNYAERFYSWVGRAPGVDMNPKWAVLPDGFTPPKR